MINQAQTQYDVIIIGDGCAGFMLLYELAKFQDFSSKKVLLLGDGHENQRSWCFWDNSEEAEILKLVRKSWSNLTFKSSESQKSENLKNFKYYYIPGSSFFDYFNYEFLELHKNITYIKDPVTQISGSAGNFIITSENDVHKASTIYNSVFLGEKPKIDLWQHFRGWFIKTDESIFDPNNAILMDFTPSQNGECKFMYVLPISDKHALIELTYFGPQPYPMTVYDVEIESYISKHYNINYKILEKEFGQIPMQQGAFSLMGKNGEINLGTLAGMVKSTTGYAFKRIHLDSKELAKAYFNNGQATRFNEMGRFGFYDSLLLWIIHNYPEKCELIFTQLFRNQKIELILRFLEQKTNIWEEAKIFAKLPYAIFLKALYYRLTNKTKNLSKNENIILSKAQNV